MRSFRGEDSVEGDQEEGWRCEEAQTIRSRGYRSMVEIKSVEYEQEEKCGKWKQEVAKSDLLMGRWD